MEGIVPPKPHPLRDVTVILFLLPPLAPLGERKAKAWGGHRLCAGGMRNTRQPKVCNECSVCKVRNWCGRCMAGAWRVRGWCVAGAWRVCATGVCNGCATWRRSPRRNTKSRNPPLRRPRPHRRARQAHSSARLCNGCVTACNGCVTGSLFSLPLAQAWRSHGGLGWSSMVLT